ncbi:hypothetical protein BSF38_00188 [Paludisphaera borealis]|uniref:Uncharacterized protein n=1 Tax=Paludisphaera borealis TaxID=1387353 RepID=A0A1U7CIM0_9BACT|nr:hypothetical protein BSF38_00188 [Paludisphaera borealis]
MRSRASGEEDGAAVERPALGVAGRCARRLEPERRAFHRRRSGQGDGRRITRPGRSRANARDDVDGSTTTAQGRWTTSGAVGPVAIERGAGAQAVRSGGEWARRAVDVGLTSEAIERCAFHLGRGWLRAVSRRRGRRVAPEFVMPHGGDREGGKGDARSVGAQRTRARRGVARPRRAMPLVQCPDDHVGERVHPQQSGLPGDADVIVATRPGRRRRKCANPQQCEDRTGSQPHRALGGSDAHVGSVTSTISRIGAHRNYNDSDNTWHLR